MAEDLTKALLAVFGDSKYADASVDDKTIALINFTVAAMLKLGHPQQRILGTGYMGEALMAAEKKLVLNKKSQGPDAFNPETGEMEEMKTINTPLGTKGNLSLVVPAKKAGEVKEKYYERLRETNKEKGNYYAKHTYSYEGGKAHVNHYEFSHEFISFYMEHVNCWLVPKINIGGLGCPNCTRVHRLDHLAKCEKAWLADKAAFDTSLLTVKVPGTCKKKE